MTVGEIQGHLAELYATDVLPDLISRVTDAVLDEVREWQNRPLDPIYPVVFFDALRVKIRDEGLVKNKAVYVALGLNPDGEKDVLGLWIEQSEGAKFWLKVIKCRSALATRRRMDRCHGSVCYPVRRAFPGIGAMIRVAKQISRQTRWHEYGRAAGPVKAGLRPPPSAPDGLDRASCPDLIGHQAFDGGRLHKRTDNPVTTVQTCSAMVAVVPSPEIARPLKPPPLLAADIGNSHQPRSLLPAS
jgi:hypothetical protein